jgi:hypothetical protein
VEIIPKALRCKAVAVKEKCSTIMTKMASEIGYKPLKLSENDFVWQCAFAYHYILRGDIWDKLTRYYKRDGSCLYKHYKTEAKAMRAYNKATR